MISHIQPSSSTTLGTVKRVPRRSVPLQIAVDYWGACSPPSVSNELPIARLRYASDSDEGLNTVDNSNLESSRDRNSSARGDFIILR